MHEKGDKGEGLTNQLARAEYPWTQLDIFCPLGEDFTVSARKLRQNPEISGFSSLSSYFFDVSIPYRLLINIAISKKGRSEKLKPSDESALGRAIMQHVFGTNARAVDQSHGIDKNEFLKDLFVHPFGIEDVDTTQSPFFRNKGVVELFNSPEKILFAMQFTVAVLLAQTTPELRRLSLQRLDSALEHLSQRRVILHAQHMGSGGTVFHLECTDDLTVNPLGMELRLSVQSYHKIKELIAAYPQPNERPPGPNMVGAAIDLAAALEHYTNGLFHTVWEYRKAQKTSDRRRGLDTKEVQARMEAIVGLAGDTITMDDWSDDQKLRDLVFTLRNQQNEIIQEINMAIFRGEARTAYQLLSSWVEENHGLIPDQYQQRVTERVQNVLQQISEGGSPLFLQKRTVVSHALGELVDVVVQETNLKPTSGGQFDGDTTGILLHDRSSGVTPASYKNGRILIGGAVHGDLTVTHGIEVPTDADIDMYAYREIFGQFEGYEENIAKIRNIIIALLHKHGPICAHMTQSFVLPAILDEGGLGTMLDTGNVGVYFDRITEDPWAEGVDAVHHKFLYPERPIFILSDSWLEQLKKQEKIQKGNYGYDTVIGVTPTADDGVLHILVLSETFRNNLLLWIDTWDEERVRRTFGNKDPRTCIIASADDICIEKTKG